MAEDKNAIRISELRRLWLQRPADQRTENDVVVFYGYLEQRLPHLLDRRRSDPYQNLKSDLRGLIHD
jgi:hypothetical protein